MPVYDGNQLAHDQLFDVAKLCAQAVLKSPQITGALKVKMEIITGEDLDPVMKALAALGKLELFNLASCMGWSKAHWAGQTPVLLLMGTNVRRSDLAWNCGACGFGTCAEMNHYADSITPDPLLMGEGPSCHWLGIDFAAATGWACATAWQHNVTNRLEIATGMTCRALGYLPECNYVLGLPLGPCEDMYWYSRPIFEDLMSYEMWIRSHMESFPSHFAAFYGSGRSEVKSSDRWWEAPSKKGLEPPNPEALKQLRQDVLEEIEEIKKAVESKKGGPGEASRT